MFLPLFFKTDGLTCLVVGGGGVAARKVKLLAGLSCSITIVAPQISRAARSIVDRGDAEWKAREYDPGDCRGFQLVIAATQDRAVNRAVSMEAKALGIPVNVVDDPELCSVVFPAIWRDGPLTVAVSTGGAAPFMAGAIRDRLAVHAAGMGRWVKAAARFREAVQHAVPHSNDRNRLCQEFVEATSQGMAVDSPESAELSTWLAWLRRIRGQA